MSDTRLDWVDCHNFFFYIKPTIDIFGKQVNAFCLALHGEKECVSPFAGYCLEPGSLKKIDFSKKISAKNRSIDVRVALFGQK